MGGAIEPVRLLLVFPAALIVTGALMALGGWVVQATDRAQPARFGVRELAVILREGSVRALLWCMTPWVALWSAGPPPDRAVGGRLPVLLVPGLGGGRGSMYFLDLYLRNRGWNCTWILGLPGGDPTLSDVAADVGRAVDALTRSSGAEKIDIVAHGTGGLAVAWYVAHVDRGARVRRLVTLGTPWRGTRLAVFVRGRLGAEILWGSPLLASLLPPPVPTVAIGAPDDPTVVPSSSLFPNGATAVTLEGGGHLDLLASARAFRAVQEALGGPATSPATGRVDAPGVPA